MGALFYTYSNGDILVQSLGKGATPVSTDMFDGLVSKENLAIITSISISNSETYQLFMTFDDFIHYYYFGKGVGQIQISGILFTDCSGNLPGLNNFYQMVGKNRGKLVTVSTNGFSFWGVMLDCNVSFTAEPETMANFTVNLAMTEHTLARPETGASPC